MILLHICGNDRAQIEHIAAVLLTEGLIMDVNIDPAVQRLELSEGILTTKNLVQLTGKTKSLLFTAIDERIKELCPDNLPEIYSLPIVNMDWEQASKLRADLRRV